MDKLSLHSGKVGGVRCWMSDVSVRVGEMERLGGDEGREKIAQVVELVELRLDV